MLLHSAALLSHTEHVQKLLKEDFDYQEAAGRGGRTQGKQDLQE